MLRLVLPKGSLERATMQLFEDADLAVSRASDVAYRATIADPRIDEVRILRPQEIPVYVADGLFDLGITGPGLGGGAGERGGLPRPAGLLEEHLQPGPGRPRRRRRLAGPLAGRAGRRGGRPTRPPAA